MNNWVQIKDSEQTKPCCLISLSKSNLGNDGDAVSCTCGVNWVIESGEWNRAKEPAA